VTRGARCTIALLAIAACARAPAAPAPKPQPPTASATPAPKAQAPAPSAPVVLRDGGQDIVGTVAFRGGDVYALTWGGRLRVWTGDARPARTVDLGRVLALAEDGSVAATKTKDGDDSERLEVWALPAVKRVQTRSFEHGINQVLALSRVAAYVRLNFHNHGYRSDGAVMSKPPPDWYDVFWNFAADTVDENRVYACDPFVPVPGLFMFSADGRRFACTNAAADVAWRDLRSGDYGAPELARDWMPPPPKDSELDLSLRRKPGGFHAAPYWVLSLRLTPDGKDVYVTYNRREEEGGGWRLERWTPSKTNRPGRITRLASEDAGASTKLLAISGDGRLAVLGWGVREPLTIRRAPRYQAEPLASDTASAAAISTDGRRIASGHNDGSLRLWDARTGRLIATAGP
jgi:hypothetical protein